MCRIGGETRKADSSRPAQRHRPPEDPRVVAVAAERQVDDRQQSGTPDAAQIGGGRADRGRIVEEPVRLGADQDGLTTAPTREAEKVPFTGDSELAH